MSKNRNTNKKKVSDYLSKINQTQSFTSKPKNITDFEHPAPKKNRLKKPLSLSQQKGLFKDLRNRRFVTSWGHVQELS